MKRRSFTMIEVMIGGLLSTLIISILFSHLYQQIQGQKLFDKTYAIAMQQALFHQRLSLMLTRLDANALPLHTAPSEEDHQQELRFAYDNGIDPDPLFCHTVRARIYLNRKGELILETSPMLSKEPIRKMALLSHIEHLSFGVLCFDQPLPKKAIIENTNWPQNESRTPSILKIYIRRSGQITPLVFMIDGL